jgi:hypothetical protein
MFPEMQILGVRFVFLVQADSKMRANAEAQIFFEGHLLQALLDLSSPNSDAPEQGKTESEEAKITLRAAYQDFHRQLLELSSKPQQESAKSKRKVPDETNGCNHEYSEEPRRIALQMGLRRSCSCAALANDLKPPSSPSGQQGLDEPPHNSRPAVDALPPPAIFVRSARGGLRQGHQAQRDLTDLSRMRRRDHNFRVGLLLHLERLEDQGGESSCHARAPSSP